MAISPTFSIARSALLAQEAALSVTGNNIANVNTPGFTRQVVELASESARPTGLGVLVGGGVRVGGVTQVTDPILARRLAAAETARREQGALSDELSALAALLSDVETPSLASTLAGFFDAAEELARDPQGLAERETLLGSATALAREVNRRAGAVANLQRDADGRLGNATTQANDLLTELAGLNRAIVGAELAGGNANELRDRRQQALIGLTGLLGVTAVEDTRGSLSVFARNGITLVQEGDVVHSVATRAGSAGLDGQALTEIGLVGSSGSFLDVPDAFGAGEVGGLRAVRDDHLVAAAADLDTLAIALRDGVNAIQTDPAARDLDGNAPADAPLFGGTGAADLSVLMTDPRRIAAALSTEPGDSQNALRLADLRTTRRAALGGVTFSAFLSGQQARVGEAAARAGDAASVEEAFMAQLESQRESLSGVNLNEELTNLLKHQRAFQAASRLLGVADAVLTDLFEAV
jgi:flagellar hook-associated protein 1 FlgK